MARWLVGLVLVGLIGVFAPSILAQGFNVASTYQIADPEAVSGDIIVSDGERGLVRSEVNYDNKMFGVMEANPILVLREASSSGQAVIRAGDAVVNVTDINGEIKRGDFVTTSTIPGKGMRAGTSGYAIGIAIADADLSGEAVNFQNRQYRSGTVPVAMRIEYTEINTARNNIRLLQEINAALFSTVKDPEKAVLIIRYLIGGIIAILAFGIGFFSVSHSIAKAVEAIGRNPLARRSILISIGLQLLITFIGAIATIVLIFIIIRIWAQTSARRLI